MKQKQRCQKISYFDITMKFYYINFVSAKQKKKKKLKLKKLKNFSNLLK